MMADGYYDMFNMKNVQAPPGRPSLRTGTGHGHFRGPDREKPKKDAWAKKHKRAKMRKDSRKRNRRGKL